MDHLVAGARHTQVPSAVGHSGCTGGLQVGPVIADDLLGVSLAYAETGLTAGIDGLDHAGAASCYVDVAGCQQLVGGLDGAVVGSNDLDQVFRCAQLCERGTDHVDCLLRDELCLGMGSYDDGISALDGSHAVHDDRDDGVGGGADAADDADGLGDDTDTGFVIGVFDEAHGSLATHGVPLAGGGSNHLGDLIGHSAHASLFDHFGCQLFLGVVDGQRDGADNLIHRALGGEILFEFLLRCSGVLDQTSDVGFCFRHLKFPPYQKSRESGISDEAHLCVKRGNVRSCSEILD